MEEKENKTEQPSEKVEITRDNSNNSDIVDKKKEKQLMRYSKELIEKALEKESKDSKDSKEGIGFVLGFFFSLIGLIIGLILYSGKTGDEMTTFTSGWGKGFLVSFVFSVIVCVVYYLAILPLIK